MKRGWRFLWLILGAVFPLHAEELIVISPHWDGIKEETARAFSAWHEEHYGKPVTIRWRQSGGGGSEIIRFLRAEYQTSPSAGIDVLYGGGIDPFLELKENGLLERTELPPEILTAIPANLNGFPLYDPDHEWYGAALSGFGILINERVLAATHLPEVQTWSDLADPRLQGWVTVSDPRLSSTAMVMDEIILQGYGWEKGWGILAQINGNARSILSSSAAAAVEVGVGEAAYGLAVDLYGQAQVSYYGAENLRFVLPAGQTVLSPDGIAVLKNPPHPELARHFLEFVLSPAGQSLWMLPRGTPGGSQRYLINRMSILPGLYQQDAAITPVKINPFTQSHELAYSSQLSGKRRSILSALLAAWFMDTHDDLVKAWKRINQPELPAEKKAALLTRYLTPPMTEEELLHLAETDWKSPAKRITLINAWQSEALQRDADLQTNTP